MNQHHCPVCSHEGRKSEGSYLDKVFQPLGKEVSLPLCYNHSVEFFKRGQSTFIRKYQENLSRYSLVPETLNNPFKSKRRIDFN